MPAAADCHFVIPGRTHKRANPESTATEKLRIRSGFRARVLRTRPGMTASVAAAVFLTVLAGAPASAAEIKVGIDNFTFNPKVVTVKTGDTVVWTNKDDIPHTVTDPGKFRSKALDTDDSFSFTFTTPGSYSYFCSLHPMMTGKIVVEAATGDNGAK